MQSLAFIAATVDVIAKMNAIDAGERVDCS